MGNDFDRTAKDVSKYPCLLFSSFFFVPPKLTSTYSESQQKGLQAMGVIAGPQGRLPLQNRCFSLIFRQSPSCQICTSDFTVSLDLFTAPSHLFSTAAFLVFLRPSLRKAHPLHPNFPTGSFATPSYNTHQF